MQKTAVILFNLGGPDERASIKPFLFNFFMDKNIIGAPLPIRWMLAKLISVKRSKQEAGDSYGFLGDKSPLLENTQKQAEALQKKLPQHMKVFVSMRYWHPRAEDVIEQVKEWGAQRLIFLPLYPQFSTTTSFSSVQEWQKQARKQGLKLPSKIICCYPWDGENGEGGFIGASADLIRKSYEDLDEQARKKGVKAPRLLFSAHGLPEVVVKRGDPYQWQCEQSAQKIVDALAIENLDWSICYQSRVGPLKWIGPSTEEELERAAHDNVPVLIYPHAFVSEHVETLVELDIEYREEADKMGVPLYGRAPTVMDHPKFIQGLADTVLAYDTGAEDIRPNFVQGRSQSFCQGQFKRCACQWLPDLISRPCGQNEEAA